MMFAKTGRLKTLLCTAVAVMGAAGAAFGQQDLVRFPSGNAAGSVPGVTLNGGVTGQLSRGAGIIQETTAGTYNSQDFTLNGTLALAITNNDYLSFTVVPGSGSSVSVSQMRMRYDRSNTGPNQVVLLSSVTGFTTSATPIYTDTSVNASGENVTFTVTGHDNQTGPIEFRLYAFGATNTGGTFDFEALPTPEPATTGIIVAGSVNGAITTGTCCVGTTCSIVADAAACAAAGGTNFVAGFDTCPPTACQPPAPGACCVGTTCVLAADLAACTAQGGTNFNASQTTCTGVTCTITTGACCATGGGCTIVANAAACSGGTFIAGVAGTTCPANSCPTAATPGDVVFSQVYGAGGNNGAVFNADYAELFNRTAAPINVSGWSIQYFSAAGGAGGRVTLPSGTIIPSRQYLLVKIGSAGSTGAPLSFDVDSSAIAASATDGRLVLVSNATALPAGCPTSDPSVVDLIGYGTATCFEGSAAAPAASATSALFRADNGCTDTNNNASNFAAGTPAPRNLASPAAVCGGGTAATGTDSTAVTSACAGSSVDFAVTVTPGSNAVITGVTADFTSIGGSAGVAMTPDAGNPLIFRSTQQITLLPNTTGVTLGNKNIPVSIQDAGGLTGLATIDITVANCTIGINGSSFARATPCVGDTQTLTILARPAQSTPGVPVSTNLSATIDFDQALLPGGIVNMNGPSGPDANGNFTFSYSFPAASGFNNGPFALRVRITDGTNFNDYNGLTGQDTNARYSVIPGCTESVSTVVISQVYGGGGNARGLFRSDFVELFNRSSQPVDLTGWSIQYASARNTGGGFTAGNVTALSGSIPAGGYYLVKLGDGADLTQPALPTPDATGTTALSASNGRVALVRTTTPQLLSCTGADIADLVGYGTGSTSGAECFEGLTAASGLDNEFAAIRINGGCADRDQNAADFLTSAPTPRNSSSPLNNCSGVVNTPPTVSAGAASPTSACAGQAVSFSVTVTAGNSAVSTVTANLAPIGGSAAAALTAGSGGSYSIATTVGSVAVGAKSIVVTATDANGLTGTFSIPFTVTNCTPTFVVCCRGVTCTTVANSGNCTAPAGVGIRVLDPATTSCVGQSALNSGCCYADFNKSGVKDVADIFAYLSAWFANSTFADVGGDGTGARDVSDIFQFLSAWFAGCS